MSDLNMPGERDGIQGEEPPADTDLPDEGGVAGAPETEPGGLGHVPMPPD